MSTSTKIPAYGPPAAKAPFIPFTIERRRPAPHDLEIETLYCGICHSDVHKVNDDWPSTLFPVLQGHEIVGRVASRGAGATRFQKGDLVGVGCIVDSCRVCPECRAGHEMFCEKGVSFTFDSFDQNIKTWTYVGYSTRNSLNADLEHRPKVSSQRRVATINHCNPPLGQDLHAESVVSPFREKR